MTKRLTQHFDLSEFTESSTAKKLGIINVPDLRICNNIEYGCVNVLEPLAEYLKEPIIISSGYRCLKLNKAVGGKPTSQHMTGEAADIHIPNAEYARKVFDFLKVSKFVDQLLYEKSKNAQWLHVSWSVNRDPRHYINQNYHV